MDNGTEVITRQYNGRTILDEVDEVDEAGMLPDLYSIASAVLVF